MFALYRWLGPEYWLVGLAFQVLCAAHCVRTGRNRAWLAPIIFFSLVGCLVYFFVEVVPGMQRSRTLTRVIDPHRDLRQGSTNYAISNNVETTRQYAEELMRHGKFQEAAELYGQARKGIFEHDPVILLGLGNAYFGLKRYAECIAVLDDLMQHHPRERTPDAHLVYAQALENAGRVAEALREYRQLAASYPGPEAKCRYALLLKKRGSVEAAQELFREVALLASNAPGHYQRLHKQWIQLARSESKTAAFG